METDLNEPADDDDDDDDDPKGVSSPLDSSLYDSVAVDPFAAESPYDNVVDSDSRYNSVAGGGDDGVVVNKPFFIADEDVDSGGDDADSPELLARHLGVGGYGPLVADRLALLANLPSSPSSRESSVDAGVRTLPKMLPSLYFGDMRAGDVEATAQTMELCHKTGVQAFSLRYVGGIDGEKARKGAAAAADYEHEDVSVACTRDDFFKLRNSEPVVQDFFFYCCSRSSPAGVAVMRVFLVSWTYSSLEALYVIVAEIWSHLHVHACVGLRSD